jgi:hypothetical protein
MENSSIWIGRFFGIQQGVRAERVSGGNKSYTMKKLMNNAMKVNKFVFVFALKIVYR